MTQRDLDRQVARATGETVSTIRSMGFGLMEMPDPEPQIVDWDELQSERLALLPQCLPPRRAIAA